MTEVYAMVLDSGHLKAILESIDLKSLLQNYFE